MPSVESTQSREINATHQRAPKTRCALRFLSPTIGELEVFRTQIHRHQLPPMEEMCQFCHAVKWKDETANSWCRSGNVVLAQVHDFPQDFKELLKDGLLLDRVRS